MSSSNPVSRPFAVRATLAGFALGAAAFTAGCQDQGGVRALRPLSSETLALFDQKGVRQTSPTLLRAYKKEAELEVWKQKADGTYVHVKTFPMCRWSGQLGPKKREGDRQVPEGFYSISPGQMNPNSNYYLSFNVGYPNAYDRAHGRSGALIMVHGACSSAGCFSMTDEQIAELYAIARESFAGGQRAIQMQSLPFRMTTDNLAKYRLDPNMSFWRELKRGADMFEVTKREPAVGVCGARYSFNVDADGCAPTNPEIASQVAAKAQRDDQEIAELATKVKPVKIVYADGGQHESFRHTALAYEVSRPDALAQGPTEIEIEDGKGKKPVAVAVAAAKPGVPAPGAATAQAVAASAAATATLAAQGANPAAKVAANPAAKIAAAPVAAPTVTNVARAGAKPVLAAPSPAPAALASADQVETQAFYKRWLGYGSAPEKPAAAAAVELPPSAAKPSAIPPARPLSLARATAAQAAPVKPGAVAKPRAAVEAGAAED